MPFKKGHPSYHTAESRKKIGDFRRGKKLSKKTKEKLRKVNIGRKITWGQKISDTNKEKGIIPPSRKGIKWSIAHRKRMSKKMKGKNAPNWKGGITKKNLKIRNSFEYRLWREAVFRRDNYTCIFCGYNKGGNLVADHIKPFSLFPELRIAIDNGRTLCIKCHKKTDTYLERIYAYKKAMVL